MVCMHAEHRLSIDCHVHLKIPDMSAMVPAVTVILATRSSSVSTSSSSSSIPYTLQRRVFLHPFTITTSIRCYSSYFCFHNGFIHQVTCPHVSGFLPLGAHEAAGVWNRCENRRRPRRWNYRRWWYHCGHARNLRTNTTINGPTMYCVNTG